MGTVKNFIRSIKLKEGFKFDHQVAELIDVDPAKLANWKSRESLPTLYQKWYCDKYDIEIKDFHEEIKLTNTEIRLKEEPMDAKVIIDLQQDKIKQQEKEIASYKNYLNTQPLQKLQFEDIQEDMSSVVEVRNVFSLKPMERKMKIGVGGEKLEQLLGLPKGHNYFAPDEWHTFDSHPVDAIMAKDTLKELKQITRTLPSLFESLKFMVGNHYMSFPVVYEYKNKRVLTQCSILLDWMSSPKRILTKTKILNGKKD